MVCINFIIFIYKENAWVHALWYCASCSPLVHFFSKESVPYGFTWLMHLTGSGKSRPSDERSIIKLNAQVWPSDDWLKAGGSVLCRTIDSTERNQHHEERDNGNGIKAFVNVGPNTFLDSCSTSTSSYLRTLTRRMSRWLFWNCQSLYSRKSRAIAGRHVYYTLWHSEKILVNFILFLLRGMIIFFKRILYQIHNLFWLSIW